MTPSSLNWNGQTLVFLPDKALWVEEQQLLLIADVHLGKADHLQAHGIAIPSEASGPSCSIANSASAGSPLS